MSEQDVRESGSVEEFESDWQMALASDSMRYFIYPDRDSGRQADLFEWIKAQQIEKLLGEMGATGGSVLEYGCGSAGISLYLSQRGYDAHLCDLSPYALRVAERNLELRAPEAEIASMTVSDVKKLPYADNSFDLVMSYGLFEHFEEDALNQMLKDTIRVLKPGGIFLADIVPGPERGNARTFGLIINYIGSVLYHLVTGKWARIPKLFTLYFNYYFENTYSDKDWYAFLEKHNLADIQVDVCRPFPPLAIAGKWEERYTRFILRYLKGYQRFDQANNWFTRRWGWMYLARGRKQGA